MMNPGEIDARMSVNDVIRNFPATVSVFNAMGVDACCGGEDSLEAAAANVDIDLGKLLPALDDAIAAIAGTAS